MDEFVMIGADGLLRLMRPDFQCWTNRRSPHPDTFYGWNRARFCRNVSWAAHLRNAQLPAGVVLQASLPLDLKVLSAIVAMVFGPEAALRSRPGFPL